MRPPAGFPGVLVTPFGVSLALSGCALCVFFAFFGDVSMSALFLCYLRWVAMYDPYTPANVLQGFAKLKKRAKEVGKSGTGS